MTIEYKDFRPVLKALDETGNGQAIIATLNSIDRDNDVTLPLAFGEQYVKLLVGHEWKAPAVGDARLYEVGHQVIADFAINLNMHAGREIYESLKWDAKRHKLAQWSYGFQVLDHAMGEHEGKQVRFLKKVHAFEVSPVVVGAGIGTGTLDIKAAKRWPGMEVRRMSHPKAEQMQAVTSIRGARRPLLKARDLLERDASPLQTARAIIALDEGLDALAVAHEHQEKAIDALESYEVPVPTTPDPPARVIAPEGTAAEEPGEEESMSQGEKGGMPLAEEIEDLISRVEKATERLEYTKQARAKPSERYPNGRPPSSERLAQVDRLQQRLSQLKTTVDGCIEADAAQQQLQAMAERFKRFETAV